MNQIISNAIINDVRVCLYNGCILTIWVDVKHAEGMCQGFGGYTLGGVPSARCGKHHEQPNLAAEFIVGLLRACEVENLSHCQGKAIRVMRDEPRGLIRAVGHILDDDKWMNPGETFRGWGVD